MCARQEDARKAIRASSKKLVYTLIKHPLQTELSHSWMRSSTAAAAVSGHSTVDPAYDRFTIQTGY